MPVHAQDTMTLELIRQAFTTDAERVATTGTGSGLIDIFTYCH